MSASLGIGPTRWHMQNMQTSEFFHLLGHSSGSAGSWDVFRGRWHNTAISGKLLWQCVLSRAGWGCLCNIFHHLFQFQVPVRSAILIPKFCYGTIHRIFVTSFAGRYKQSTTELVVTINIFVRSNDKYFRIDVILLR